MAIAVLPDAEADGLATGDAPDEVLLDVGAGVGLDVEMPLGFPFPLLMFDDETQTVDTVVVAEFWYA